MKNLKSLLLLSLVVFAITKTNAQVGIGTTNPFAALDVFSGNDGLLIPRVALTATTTVLPVLTGTESEIVYNTNTAGDVTPGFYYLSTNTGPWVRLAAGATNSWLITGNSNIVDGTNFLGTTNNVDVAFRRSGTAAGKIGTTNTSFGINTYNSFASSNITCFGANAGSLLTGQDNTAIGANAMDGISAGASRQNTAVGFNALTATTAATVANCTAVGYQAGANVTSIDNTAIGNNALLGSAGSEKSTAVGAGSMEQQSAGFNTAVGFRALFNGDATGNVAVGNQAGEFHGSGALCTMIGFQASAAGFTNSAAFGNGAVAGASNNIKFGNAAIVANHFTGKIGLSAAGVVPNGSLDLNVTNDGIVPPKAILTSTGTVAPVVTGIEGELIYNTNTAGDVTPGYYYLTTAVGPWARLGGTLDWGLLGNAGTNPATNFIGTTDAQDLRFRRQNQWSGTIAQNVTSFGFNAGRTNTSTNNVFFGSNAGELSNAAASSNMVAIGHQAMGAANQNVSQSVAIGSFAMQSPAATATNNVAIGHQAGISLSSSNNVVIGQGTSALGNSVVIGQGASGGFTGTVVIGPGATATQAGHIRIAGSGTVLATTPASWTVISDRRAKSNIKDSAIGLDFLKTLRPVSYFKKNDENKKTEYGFIAQEVEASLKKVGDNNNGVIYVDPDGNYGMRYNDIIPITVKAVQEQQELIEELQKANAELVKANAAILKRLAKLEKSKSD